MSLNWLYVIGAGILVPLLVGMIWYNPKVFGNAWMASTGMTEEKSKGANMPLIFGLTALFGVMFASTMVFMVIHQAHINSILQKELMDASTKDATTTVVNDFMSKYGTNFRTFKHGAFHGVISAIFFVLPIVAITSMFERRGFKFIAITTGYWMVVMALIGGIICGFA
jgi:hypothetical protein